MKKLIAVTVIALASLLPGCAAVQRVQPMLNDVQAAIGDASAIVETIRSVVAIFFLAHPAPETQVKVEKILADVALGISTASRALDGVQDVSQEQLDKAWSEFRASYAELTTLLKDIGIVSADGKMATKRGSVGVPEPLAMRTRTK